MINKNQADIILMLLEYGTDGNWPNVSRRITEESGYTPKEVVAAWKALEDASSMSGVTPDEGDF